MTLQEVQKLIDAGFSHDEIMSFQQNPQDNPQPEQQPEPEPEPQPEPEPEQQPEPKPQPEQPDYNALNETINRLIKTIQASNLQNATRESLPVIDLNKQVDDIMKSIITGTEKKED